MQVQLQSTEKIVTLNINGAEVPARVWEGATANGVACHAFITRIAVAKDDDTGEFDRDLKECHRAPSAAVAAIPLSMILALLLSFLLSTVVCAASGGPPASWQLCDGKTIANLATNPVASVRDGAWSDPATWAAGKVPSDRDNVLVSHRVVVDRDTTALNVLVYGGRLETDAAQPLSLRVAGIQVTEGGKLTVTPTARQEIVIRDLMLPDIDAGRHGAGIVAFGNSTWQTIDIEGVTKTPYLAAATGVKAGDAVKAAPDWISGDVVVMGDTRPRTPNDAKIWVNQRDVSTVGGVWKFAHPAAIDSLKVERIKPSIANLTRSVVICSENPSGTRGHLFAAEQTLCTIRGVELRDMGRTQLGTVDNSNVNGRYPLHAHHCTGAVVFDNCTVRDSRKWAIVIHATNGATVTNNVVYVAQGAGVVLEDGSERANTIAGNLVISVWGYGVDYDIAKATGEQTGSLYLWGSSGKGYVLRSGDNWVYNNRAEGVEGFGTQSGFSIFPRDVNPAIAGRDARLTGTAGYRFDGNVVLGAAVGLDAWDLSGNGKKNLVPDPDSRPRWDLGITVGNVITGSRTYETVNTTLKLIAIKGKVGYKSAPSYQQNLVISGEIDGQETGISVPSWAQRVDIDCTFRGCGVSLAFGVPSGLQTPPWIPTLAVVHNFKSQPWGKNNRPTTYGINNYPLTGPWGGVLPATTYIEYDGQWREWFMAEQAASVPAPVWANDLRTGLDPIFGPQTNGWAEAHASDTAVVPVMVYDAKLKKMVQRGTKVVSPVWMHMKTIPAGATAVPYHDARAVLTAGPGGYWVEVPASAVPVRGGGN